MTELKCKVCGGAIERKGNFYVCLHCRTKWVIDVADDVHAVDRANAWAALRDGNFERATELFENIILKDKNGHEAYWGRALATNGIIYVTDLSENKKVPTCNNITENSFINNSDVKKAISLAPDDIAESYKSQAEYIEKVRIEWLEKASKEPEYDVFISFKDSDRENGIERTQDSIDAQDLYNALSAEGYKVFFSRISLRDKISEQYEPYIYNAIKTAKVMIVFGEKAEYFSSVWIKNEWSRFKTRIEKGEKHKNLLVVVYKNMNPGDLPAVLSSRQCLNAADIMYFTDLNRHIKKVIELSKQSVHLDRVKIEGGQIAKKATELTVNTVKTREIGAGAIAETSISEKQSVSLINTYLKASDWSAADSLIEEVLFDNPSCAEAIWCKILKNNRASDEQALLRLLSSPNAYFNDFALLEKLLNCSSKDFAAHILDLFYGISFASDALHKSVLERILPFDYPNREKKIKEAFNSAISTAHLSTFELLLGTLASDEVDRYVAYNLAFANATSETVTKRKVLGNVLSVDEGNLEALRTVVDTDIVTKTDTAKIIADFETLLKFTTTNDDEVVRVLNALTAENHSLGQNVIAFARQLIRYYHGDKVNLKDKLLKFSNKLLKYKSMSEAEYYFNLIISVDKNCAEAYWGLCLVKVGAVNEADVVNREVPIKNCAEFNKYLTLVDEKRRVECIELTKQQERNKEKKNEGIKKQIKLFNKFLEVYKNKKTDIILENNKIKDNKNSIYKEKKLAITALVFFALGIILVIKAYLAYEDYVPIEFASLSILISVLAIIDIVIIGILLSKDLHRSSYDDDGELIFFWLKLFFLTIITVGIYMLYVLIILLGSRPSVKPIDAQIVENEKRISEENKNIDEINAKIQKYNSLLKNIEEGRNLDEKTNEQEIKKIITKMDDLEQAKKQYEEGIVEYRLIDEKEYQVCKFKGGKDIGNVFILDEINGKPVTSIGDDVFGRCDYLASVIIPDYVTTIHNSAFRECRLLKSIVIPDLVTTIGSGAFKFSGLTSVVIGNSVTSIDGSAFAHCSSLASIKYKGTEKQWETISKVTEYDYGWDKEAGRDTNAGKYSITYNYTEE